MTTARIICLFYFVALLIAATPNYIPGLTDGVAVTVSLRAINGIGSGASSATLSVTPTTSTLVTLSNYVQDITQDPVAITFEPRSCPS